jgi:hypothetical protein
MLNGDLDCYKNEELYTSDNQGEHINALYKYHFDFRRLIDQGIALNKLNYGID